MSKIKIIHEPNSAEPFLVLEKPAAIPSAPLSQTDENSALFQAVKLFPQIKNVYGKKEIEYGLLHRIDTATQGLLLIATEQEFYDHILRVQENGEFIKTYFAECDFDADNAKKLGGFPEVPFLQELERPPSMPLPLPQTPPSMHNGLATSKSIEIVSYFRAYGKGRREVRPVLENSNSAALKKSGAKKLYSTKILSLEQAGGMHAEGGATKITCSITQGFRHQVRCHLAWRGYPVKGDALYNHNFRASMPNGLANSNAIERMRFFATGLQFPDLYSDKVFEFKL